MLVEVGLACAKWFEFEFLYKVSLLFKFFQNSLLVVTQEVLGCSFLCKVFISAKEDTVL